MSVRKQTNAKKVQPPKTFVYCGPTVRGVAKQYTVYHDGLPKELETFCKQHPAARMLCVPLDKLAATRQAMETHGTAQAALYKQIIKEL